MSEAREEFTAEEYRLAARVAGVHAVSASWLRKANRLDAEELARLKEHGRIVPEGGMVLTAEQVRIARRSTELVDRFVQLGSNSTARANAQWLRSLFVSAEVAPCRGCIRDECPDCAVVRPVGKQGARGGIGISRGKLTGPDAAESWATWQDVPEAVSFTSRDANEPGTWHRRGNSVYSNDYGTKAVPTTLLDSIAPFVRAEAGDGQ